MEVKQGHCPIRSERLKTSSEIKPVTMPGG